MTGKLHGESEQMKAKSGYRKQKSDSPAIGKWLKWYFEKKTCRKYKSMQAGGNFSEEGCKLHGRK